MLSAGTQVVKSGVSVRLQFHSFVALAHRGISQLASYVRLFALRKLLPSRVRRGRMVLGARQDTVSIGRNVRG